MPASGDGLHEEDPWPTLEDVRDAAAEVAAEARRLYGDDLVGVWLYGSRARGDNLPGSDLDLLLVLTSKDVDPLGRRSVGLISTLYIKDPGDERWWSTSLHTAYLEQFEEWDTMFYRNVRADAVRVA